MKVGTDGVILGAWTRTDHTRTILDVGTGTGLLALMLAQKCSDADIDAIEIDEPSASQARENVQNSKFRDHVRVLNISFQEYSGTVMEDYYDLIISNPPYFTASKQGPVHGRNLARHDDRLSLDLIVEGSCKILSGAGRLNLILPASARGKLDMLLGEKGLSINRMLEIIPAPGKNPARICFEISRQSSEMLVEQMVIETGKRHQYSEAYKLLTSPFYL